MTRSAALPPASRGRVVRFARLDPAGRSRRRIPPLPERRLGLQPVDQERGGLQRRLARCAAAASTSTMLSPGCSRPTRWMTVQPSRGQRRSASSAMRRDRALGHARIVLQRHRGDAVAGVGRAPCRRSSRCRRYRCGRRSARRIRRRQSKSASCTRMRRHAQPPVTGGKNATSSPGPQRRRDRRELLVHRAAHRAAVGEGGGVAGAARAPARSTRSATVRTPGGRVSVLLRRCRRARAARRNTGWSTGAVGHRPQLRAWGWSPSSRPA